MVLMHIQYLHRRIICIPISLWKLSKHMRERIELLTSYLVMNGWMADEIAVQQQFILHPMPNSL